jgi:hypothetical protein
MCGYVSAGAQTVLQLRPFAKSCISQHYDTRCCTQCLPPTCSLLTGAATTRCWCMLCLQKDPALRPNADQLFEHPFIAAAASSAPPQLLLRIVDLGQRRRPVVGGRGSEPGGDYAVRDAAVAVSCLHACMGLLCMHAWGKCPGFAAVDGLPRPQTLDFQGSV